ncbi:hypothetical protein B0T14DRAFT_96085 [Immersiella caudata]|uniref:Uncharacterized protein n=1 Tax=Immersiella caudata TaxID=314043 RepID=A0AA39X2P8_9PEZI|nr:hypothetical protein B0T14DRAFT_96085 [Immersiella caudata]
MGPNVTAARTTVNQPQLSPHISLLRLCHCPLGTFRLPVIQTHSPVLDGLEQHPRVECPFSLPLPHRRSLTFLRELPTGQTITNHNGCADCLVCMCAVSPSRVTRPAGGGGGGGGGSGLHCNFSPGRGRLHLLRATLVTTQSSALTSSECICPTRGSWLRRPYIMSRTNTSSWRIRIGTRRRFGSFTMSPLEASVVMIGSLWCKKRPTMVRALIDLGWLNSTEKEWLKEGIGWGWKCSKV